MGASRAADSIHRQGRRRAAFLLLVLGAALLFAPLHAHHDCTGAGCAVCAAISAVQEALGSLSAGPAAAVRTHSSRSILLPVSAAPLFWAAALTPVSQKIKLNS